MRRHGGAIDVRSRAGEGARFDVYLPLATRAAAPPPATQAPGAPTRPERPLRVLVLEDDEHVAGVIVSMLCAEGHHVTVSREGRETIRHFARALHAGEPYDVALLDLTVPGGLGGREILPQLRAHDPKVRAIATSGYSARGTLADYARHGFVAALPKPYRLEELLAALARATTHPAP